MIKNTFKLRNVIASFTNTIVKGVFTGNTYPVAYFTKEVKPRLAKRPLKTNGRLANRGLTY